MARPKQSFVAFPANYPGTYPAIPATLAYNGLARRVDVLNARWSSLRETP